MSSKGLLIPVLIWEVLGKPDYLVDICGLNKILIQWIPWMESRTIVIRKK